MKKTISMTVLAGAVLFLGAGASVSAQTTDSTATTTAAVATTAATTTVATTTTVTATTTVATSTISNARIVEMLEQIKKLTALLATLRAQMSSTTSQIHELAGELRLGLKSGMTGEDIKAIQEALASDPSIYPAGLKTGYFGPMTVEAIKRFQTKNGLEVTGEINAETKAALDTVLETRRSEGKFPLGLLLNPVMKQKFEERIKTACTGTSTAATTAGQCEQVRTKYKFEIDDKGRIKAEAKVQREDDEDDSDDADEDDDNDDDHKSGNDDDADEDEDEDDDNDR